MKHTTIIIIFLSIALAISIYISFSNHSYYKLFDSNMRKQQTATEHKLKLVIIKSKKDSVENDKNMAELLISRAAVERYKIRYANALKKESNDLRKNKEVLHYTDLRIDSAFRAMYPLPDSIRIFGIEAFPHGLHTFQRIGDTIR